MIVRLERSDLMPRFRDIERERMRPYHFRAAVRRLLAERDSWKDRNGPRPSIRFEEDSGGWLFYQTV